MVSPVLAQLSIPSQGLGAVANTVTCHHGVSLSPSWFRQITLPMYVYVHHSTSRDPMVTLEIKSHRNPRPNANYIQYEYTGARIRLLEYYNKKISKVRRLELDYWKATI